MWFKKNAVQTASKKTACTKKYYFFTDHIVKPFNQGMIISTESERRILDAARQEFEKKGYSGTRMQRIAEVAGISKASLHYYFRSKDNLFQKIFDEAVDEYLPLVNTWTDDSLNWEEKILRFTDEFMRFNQKGNMLFIIREINRNPDLLTSRIKKSKFPNRFVTYFGQVMAEKNIRNSDVNVLYIILQSICCFPAMNNQLFQKALQLSDKQYSELMQGYAKAAANFFINAIKK